MRDIGKNIKQIRIQKDMTQDELAERLYVTRQTVSNYETGKSRPDIDMLVKIAEVLEVSVNEILYEPEDMAARRKKQFQRCLILGGGAVVMFIGWLLLQKLWDYVMEYGSRTYDIFPRYIAAFFVSPAYFLLLGFLLSAVFGILLAVKPLKHRLCLILRAVIPAAMAVYLAFTINMVLDYFTQIPVLPITEEGYRWFMSAIAKDFNQNWLFLLFGFLLGLTFIPKPKNTPER